MPVCAVKSCKNASDKNKKDAGITFHLFPADPVVASVWIKIIRRGREDSRWKPSKFTVLCSSHFQSEDIYITKCGLRRIHKGAVPTKLLYISSIMSDNDNMNSNDEKTLNLDCHGGPSTSRGKQISSEYKTQNQKCSEYKKQVEFSDSSSNFDTAKKSRLRMQLRKKGVSVTGMPGCALRYCKNTSKNVSKSAGITFHRFLRSGHEKREAWIKFVRNDRSEDTWLPSEHTYICSAHFREEDFMYTNTGRKFLKKSAVPIDKKKLSKDSTLAAYPPLSIHLPLSRASTSSYKTTTEKLFSYTEQKAVIDKVVKLIKGVDEFDGIGINVACKLQRMDEEQSIYAELLITKILIHGINKKLLEETDFTGLIRK